MSSPLLYSTNPYMKYYIYENYKCGQHYAWFSENFDSDTLGSYAPGSMVPATSNPKDIYLDLKKAVEKTDGHNAKILAQISGLTALATTWERAGEITADQKIDIMYIVNEGKYFNYWRPLLYVVPRDLIHPSRMKHVPMSKSAGLGNEYIIEDLGKEEFGIIEL